MRSALRLATGLAAAALVSQAIAAPDAVTYQLQERCGHSAEEWFKRNFREVENTKDGQTLNNFRNHYNSKLNKCIVITYATIFNTKVKPKSINVSETLYDLNENNVLGNFFEDSHHQVYGCTFGDKSCASRTEWEQLIKPYLEN